MLSGEAPNVERARALRKAMSLPEALLWRELKRRPLGLKFRRQHPALGYTLDFYCHEAKLIIEVDGSAHDHPQRASADAQRDALFRSKGFHILRIPAADVLRDLGSTVTMIVARAASGTPLRHAFGATPPPQGEEL